MQSHTSRPAAIAAGANPAGTQHALAAFHASRLNKTTMALAICGIAGFCQLAAAQQADPGTQQAPAVARQAASVDAQQVPVVAQAAAPADAQQAPAAVQQSTATVAPAAPAVEQQTSAVAKDNVVTVTGTSIRGVAAVGSQVTTLRRADIVATGATTATELLRSVPEMNNFSASGSNNGQNQANFVDQPAIHGIGVGNGGAGLTLVLFDGHRLPGAGINQTAPDAGVIPTSALERVEVMADGGSAIYGSDAVAGVINFVPRKNFDGAETNLRKGSADGYQTKNFSQLFGKKWEGGQLLLDYERSENTALDGYARSYAVNDQRPWGGPDTRPSNCTPGTITAAGKNYPVVSGAALVEGASTLCETNRGNDLYPAQHRDQVYASLRQDVSDTVELYASFLFSGRKLTDRVTGYGITSGGLSVTVPSTSPYYVPIDGVAAGTPESVTYNPAADFGTFRHQISTNTRSFVTGANVELPNKWNAKFELNYGVERDQVTEYGINQAVALSAAADGTFNPTGIGAATSADVLAQIGNYRTYYYAKHTLKDAQVKLDGPVFSLPGGTARAALGVGTRREEMYGLTYAGAVGGDYTSNPYSSLGKRDDHSLFGELFLPLVGEANQVPGVKKLDLSVAARYDKYSDVGNTTNPKIGANWTAVDGIKFRLSAGRSFHAPSLADATTAIDTRAIRYGCIPGNYIGCDNATTSDYTVLLAGGNKLKPEKANTYNVGLDIGPELLGGAKLSLTYFQVDYKDVITYPTFGPVTNSIAAYDPYRIVRPEGATDAEWAAIIAPLLEGLRHDGLVYPDVGLPLAVYDLRRQNFANEKIQGIDFNLDYKLRSKLGQWNFNLSGTHLIKFEQNVPGIAAPIVLLGTNYAVQNKVRGQVGLGAGNFTGSVAINHVGSFNNTGVTPVQKVSSFNTVDSHLAWAFKDSGFLKDTTLAIDVSNIFDRNPPVFYTAGAVLGFDGNTANPLGRVISASLSKRW
jgi:iron complex outermembrane receptor protein